MTGRVFNFEKVNIHNEIIGFKQILKPSAIYQETKTIVMEDRATTKHSSLRQVHREPRCIKHIKLSKY